MAEVNNTKLKVKNDNRESGNDLCYLKEGLVSRITVPSYGIFPVWLKYFNLKNMMNVKEDF